MKVSGYPELRSASLRWVQAYPSHWKRRRLRFLLRDGYQGLKIGPFGSQIKLQDLSDSGFKIYGQENVIGRDFTLGHRYLDPAAFEELSVYEIKAMDLVVTMMGTSGRCAIVPDNIPPGIMDSHLVRLRTQGEISNHYLRYLIDESPYVRTQVDLLGKGSIMHGLNSGIIKNLDLLLPPLEEQESITKFLDWKTGEIDALISRKKELLEKLKEKRLAVITQAVTQGLNPDVPMRDSGISWLGQVPQHWIVKRLRYSAGLVTSGSRGWAQYFTDSGKLFLRITNLDRDSIELLLEDTQRVEPPDGAEGGRTLTKAGDLLISITADLGSVAVIPSGLEPAYVSQHLSLVRLDTTTIDPNWIAYSIFSVAGQYQLRMAGYGGTKVQLSLGDIKEISFCHPSTVEEQGDILHFIRAQTKQTDDLIDLTSQAIDCLKEYRTAIITAATTGKIDVRNVKVPTQG